MDTEKIFRTKSGFCHILSDKIILSRNGIRGDFSKVVVGNNISRILIIYTILSCILMYGAYDLYVKGQQFQTMIFGLLGLYLIYGVIRSLNNSATPIIERNKIKNVIFIKAIPGITRARFEILFEDEESKIKKRVILLPGSLQNGSLETELAVKIMKEEKLLS
jgi:hypothetical protein